MKDLQEKEMILQKEAMIKAKEALHNDREQLNEDERERRREFAAIESKLNKREDLIETRLQELTEKNIEIDKMKDQLIEKEDYLAEIVQKKTEELERIAGLSTEDAKRMLMEQLKNDLAQEQLQLIRENEAKIKEIAEEKSREILSTTMQRCMMDQVVESTVSVVSLPNDEMKGRIIGREGRNIRTLETLTGVDLIIDDTPEAVVLSSFDPVRREIAKVALEKLIQDGRIHPVRIEETVEKSKEEIEQKEKSKQECLNKIKQIENELEDLDNRALAKYGEIEACDKEIKDLDEKFNERSSEIERIKELINQLREAQEKKKNELKEINEEVKKINRAINQFNDEVNANKISFNNLINEFGFIDDIDTEIQNIKEGKYTQNNSNLDKENNNNNNNNTSIVESSSLQEKNNSSSKKKNPHLNLISNI